MEQNLVVVNDNAQQVSSPISSEVIQQMLDAGVHVGRKKSSGHPKMKPYLLGIRQGVQIINVEKVAEALNTAGEFLKSVVARNGVVIVVGTKMPAKLLIKDTADRVRMPYVVERWLGGTITNFSIISKRLEYFLSQELKKSKGEFEKYTKKEQVLFGRELDRLEKKIGGIKNLKKLPDALLIVDIQAHAGVVREAKIMKIPVVAITDTNTDPTLVTYPVPANTKSSKSVKFLLDYLVKAMGGN